MKSAERIEESRGRTDPKHLMSLLAGSRNGHWQSYHATSKCAYFLDFFIRAQLEYR